MTWSLFFRKELLSHTHILLLHMCVWKSVDNIPNCCDFHVNKKPQFFSLQKTRERFKRIRLIQLKLPVKSFSYSSVHSDHRNSLNKVFVAGFSVVSLFVCLHFWLCGEREWVHVCVFVPYLVCFQMVAWERFQSSAVEKKKFGRAYTFKTHRYVYIYKYNIELVS